MSSYWVALMYMYVDENGGNPYTLCYYDKLNMINTHDNDNMLI